MSTTHQRLRPWDDFDILNDAQPAFWVSALRGIGTTGSRSLAAARGEFFNGSPVTGHGTSNLAISAWCYPVSSPASNSPIILYTGGTSATTPGLALRETQTTRVPFAVFSTGLDGAYITCNGPTALPLNTWTHLFVYVDRGTKNIYFYVNGVLVTTTPYTGQNSSFTSSADMMIGGLAATAPQYAFDGRLSRCGYFIGTLDHAAAASHLYNQGNGRYWAEVTRSDLIAAGKHYYNLNETQLSAAIDAIGTNDCIIEGTNLLTDPGFETWASATDLTNWTESISGTSTVNQESVQKRSGSYCLRLDVDGSNSAVGVYQTASVAGRTYTLSFYAKASAGTPSLKTDSLNGSPIFPLTTSYQLCSATGVASGVTMAITRNSATSTSLYIDDVSLASAQIDSAAGPREAMASDLVGGYHGVLTNMDTVAAWSTDTPDGSYTAAKLDSVGTAHGTMTGFADIDAAHVAGPDGAWGPAITDRGSSPAQGWLLSSVKDSRSASVPSTLNTRIFDEYYSEPSNTGSRWLDETNDQRFDLATAPAYGTGNFTFEGWFYPTSVSGTTRYMLGTGATSGTTIGVALYYSSLSAPRVDVCNGTSLLSSSSSVPTVRAYEWQHFVVVCNRTANTLQLWLNGTLLTTLDISTLTGTYTPVGATKSIGAYGTADATLTFPGAVSRVRFYIGNALSAAEIAHTYNGGKGRAYSELEAAHQAKVTHSYSMAGASGAGETCEKASGNNLTVGGTGTISSAASPYLPAYDATLTGFTSSPRSSDVPTVLAGKCKSLQGADGKYATTGTKTVTGMGARSVAVWMKRNGAPSVREDVIGEGTSSAVPVGFSLHCDTSGWVTARIANGSAFIVGNAGVFNSGVSVCDNAWHLVVVTWDGTTNASGAKMYVDGVLVDSDTASATSQGGESTTNFQISGYNGAAGVEFQGLLCRPQVWSGRALSLAEQSTLYAGGDVTEGLTAEWRFNEDDMITVPFEHSLECDGANTIVDCGSEIIGTGAVTISGWAMHDGAGETSGRFFENGKASLRKISGTQFAFTSDGGANEASSTTTAIATGSWWHWAVQRDAAGFVRLFVNGNPVALTGIKTLNAGTPVAGTTNLYLANRQALDRTFDGRIGQVRIDSGALTQAQIRQLAQGKSPVPPTNDWRFDNPISLPYLSGCKAIRFDGVDDYVTMGDVLDVGTSDATLAGWFKGTGAADSQVRSIIGKTIASGTVGRFYIGLDATTRVPFALVAMTAGVVQVSGTVSLVDGYWHHVAATLDRDGMLTLFVDGVSTGTPTSAAAGAAENLDGTDSFAIGFINGTTPYPKYTQGDFADGRFYSAALTQAQIRKIIDGTDYLTGLAARWKFGETQRSIPSCAGGYALTFDGVDDHLVAQDINEATTALSASVWVKPTAFTTSRYCISHLATPGNYGWAIGYNNGGLLTVLLSGSGTGWTKQYVASVAMVAGCWNHLAFTYASGAVDGTLTLYVNGSAVSATKVVDTATPSLFNANAALTIGAASPSGNFAAGKLDDARVYSATLSASDIALLAAGGEPTTNPVAHWTMDDGPQYGEPSNGDPICVWEDKSGNRTNFVQTNHSACPTFVQSGQNGRPGVSFDGVLQHLVASNVFRNDPYGTLVLVVSTDTITPTQTMFAFVDTASSATYYLTFDLHATNGYPRLSQKNNDTAETPLGIPGVTVGLTKILAFRSDGMAGTIRSNAATLALSGSYGGDWLSDTPNLDAVAVGALATLTFYQPFDGTIYEAIYYPRPLSDAELRKVERILAAQYGITLAS